MCKYSSCWYGKEMHYNTQSMAFLARATESERIVRDSMRAGSRACEGANIDAQNTSNSFPFLALSLWNISGETKEEVNTWRDGGGR